MQASEILVTMLQTLDGFAFRIELGQVSAALWCKWRDTSKHSSASVHAKLEISL